MGFSDEMKAKKLLLNFFDLYFVLEKSADQFLKLRRHEKGAHYCLRSMNIIFILEQLSASTITFLFCFLFSGLPPNYRGCSEWAKFQLHTVRYV